MFTDKFSRYFRRYKLTLAPRKAKANPLPLKAHANDRRTRVPVYAGDREQDAKEVLFVSSEFVQFKKELAPCTNEIHMETIERALEVIQAAP